MPAITINNSNSIVHEGEVTGPPVKLPPCSIPMQTVSFGASLPIYQNTFAVKFSKKTLPSITVA